MCLMPWMKKDFRPSGSPITWRSGTGSVADEHSAGGGLYWIAADDLQLDLSATGGLVEAAPEWRVVVGFAWRFRVWQR